MELSGSFAAGGGDVISVQFRPDDVTKVFLVCADGTIRIHNTKSPYEHTGTLKATAADGSAEYPTLIRFLDPAKHSGELLACCISGDVLLWHAPTAKILGRFSTDRGSLQALDIRRDGQQFASAGESLAIHIFDLDHRKAAAGVLGGFRTTTQLLRPPESHGNRVQVIRYHATDPNMLFSSGWDRQVLQWNIERKCVVRHFSGPFVCGEGLDVDPGGELLLTASHRETQCIELWNIAGAAPKKVREVAPSESRMAYACQFHPRASTYACIAGSMRHQLRMVDVTTGDTVSRLESKSSLYSCAFSADGKLLVAGGVHGEVVIAKVDVSYKLLRLEPIVHVEESAADTEARAVAHRKSVTRILKKQSREHIKLDLEPVEVDENDNHDDDDDDS